MNNFFIRMKDQNMMDVVNDHNHGYNSIEEAIEDAKKNLEDTYFEIVEVKEIRFEIQHRTVPEEANEEA